MDRWHGWLSAPTPNPADIEELDPIKQMVEANRSAESGRGFGARDSARNATPGRCYTAEIIPDDDRIKTD